jgi:ABC-type transporter Mla subunit MlaD
MLNERTRNSIVGLTMIAALVAMMGGIFVLGRFPSFGVAKPYALTITAPNANGLTVGNRVDFDGVGIGTVSAVVLQPDYRGVKIILSIDSNVDIPVNAEAYVGARTIGTSFVSLKLPPEGAATTGPANARVMVSLPKDGTAFLAGSPADNGLIPQSVVEGLQALLEQRSLTDFEKQDPKTRTANISILVQRLDRLARGFDVLIGDPQVQQQFKSIVSNVHDATDDLRLTMKKIDAMASKADGIVDRAGETVDKFGAAATQASATFLTTREEIVKTSQRLAELLASIQKTTDALTAGKGTASRFINDPRLYEGLVDLTKSLKTTSDDLKVLIQKWTEEGAQLNLK